MFERKSKVKEDDREENKVTEVVGEETKSDQGCQRGKAKLQNKLERKNKVIEDV